MTQVHLSELAEQCLVEVDSDGTMRAIPRGALVASGTGCVPNGYGCCSTHRCDYHRATVEEYQAENERLKRRVAELEKALRYAADCSTLGMVKDTARGMGVIE